MTTASVSSPSHHAGDEPGLARRVLGWLRGDPRAQIQPRRAPGRRGPAARERALDLVGHLGGHLVVAPADRRTQQHRDVLGPRAGVDHDLHRAGDDAARGAHPAR